MSANGKRLGRPPIYTPEERAKDPVEFMRALGFLL